MSDPWHVTPTIAIQKLRQTFDIIINGRTARPSGQRKRNLLSWRFSLRVQRFIHSRCSQCIEIRFVDSQTLRNTNILRAKLF